MNIKNLHHIKLTLLFTLLFPCITWAINVPFVLFPIENYNQNVDTWLPPTNANYTTPLLPPAQQEKKFQAFLNHYFSVWHEKNIQKIFQTTNGILLTEKKFLAQFSNNNKPAEKIGYGVNFRPYSQQWIEHIAYNVNISQLTSLKFNPKNRAIMVNNTSLRELPTHNPHFYRLDLAGQGYPFDNMQTVTVWAGTPVYIIEQSRDKAWSLILAPNIIGWAETNTLANINEHFMNIWEKNARHQLVAITQTEATIETTNKKQKIFLSTAYIGAIFPIINKNSQNWEILFPYKNITGKAEILHAFINKNQADIMPLKATPRNFAYLLKSLQNRPYGWGGLYFYNDCSSELRNLFTPFGIWLPYNTSAQKSVGKLVDLSQKSYTERIHYLIKNGHPLMTMVYIEGHIFLYLGNFPNPRDLKHALMAMTYQDVWALKMHENAQDGRAIIGKSVFLPLLSTYPENKAFISQANREIFQLIYLDNPK